MDKIELVVHGTPPKLISGLCGIMTIVMLWIAINKIECMLPNEGVYLLSLITGLISLYYLYQSMGTERLQESAEKPYYHPHSRGWTQPEDDDQEPDGLRYRAFSSEAASQANEFLMHRNARNQSGNVMPGGQTSRTQNAYTHQKSYYADASTLQSTGMPLNESAVLQRTANGINVDSYQRDPWETNIYGNQNSMLGGYRQDNQQASYPRNQYSNAGTASGTPYQGGPRASVNPRVNSAMRPSSTMSGSVLRPRSVSPFQVDPMSSTNRGGPKRSAFLMKDSVHTVLTYGNRTITNQEVYSAAMRSLESLGGEEQVFLTSLKQLQRWILTTLFERYFEENRKNLLSINGLLLQFNKALFEADLLKDREWAAENHRHTHMENVSLRYLAQVFNSPQYRKEDWLRLLGRCQAKDAEEAKRIYTEFDKEMYERLRLDLWIRNKDYNIQTVRVHCLERIRDLRGTDPTAPNSGYSTFLGPEGHPSDAEIVVTLFVNFVLANHPGMSNTKDFEAIYKEGAIARDGSRLSNDFKIKKWGDRDTNFYCSFKDQKIDCQTGVNNAFAVCLYFLHWVRTEKMDPEHINAMGKTPDGQRLEQLIHSLTISSSYRR